LNNKEAVTELFSVIAEKIADRPGGYTRVIRTGFRKGDGAEMAMIELVDFNEIYTNPKKKRSEQSTSKTGARRTRRSKGKASAAAPAAKKAAESAASEEE
jgi:large subunit ribosomal protein L17